MKNQKIGWTFAVRRWNEDGTKLVVKKDITVYRVCRFAAKNYVQTQYPFPHIVELK
jgi:hypothetical protein